MNCRDCQAEATVAVCDLHEAATPRGPCQQDRIWQRDELPTFLCDRHARGPEHFASAIAEMFRATLRIMLLSLQSSAPRPR